MATVSFLPLDVTFSYGLQVLEPLLLGELGSLFFRPEPTSHFTYGTAAIM